MTHPSGFSRLIGRDEELQTLLRSWKSASAGDGQVVLIGGDAGIGKSRLVQELRSVPDPQITNLIAIRCSPIHRNTALDPIVQCLQRWLNETSLPSDESGLDTLHRNLNGLGIDVNEAVPLLSSVLSIDIP